MTNYKDLYIESETRVRDLASQVYKLENERHEVFRVKEELAMVRRELELWDLWVKQSALIMGEDWRGVIAAYVQRKEARERGAEFVAQVEEEQRKARRAWLKRQIASLSDRPPLTPIQAQIVDMVEKIMPDNQSPPPWHSAGPGTPVPDDFIY